MPLQTTSPHIKLLKVCLFSLAASVTGCPLTEEATDPESSYTDHTNPGADVGDDCDIASTIDANSSIDGTLEGIDDFDFFMVHLPSSGTLSAYTTGNTDTLGSILDASCTPLDVNDDGSEDTNFELALSVPSGVYYIAVAGASEATEGEYTLHVAFSTSEGQNAPADCWMNILIYSDWEVIDDDTGLPFEYTRDENQAIYVPPGVWTGRNFSTTGDDGTLEFTISSDRTQIDRFDGTSTSTTTHFRIYGGGLPVTKDSALLTTLEASIRGTAVCDVIEAYDILNLDENSSRYLGIFCDAESYLTIYCD